MQSHVHNPVQRPDAYATRTLSSRLHIFLPSLNYINAVAFSPQAKYTILVTSAAGEINANFCA
jgi:hypothetical protein